MSASLIATLMLICAVLASLAFGVLLAYGLCVAMFRIFRVQSIAAAEQREALKAASLTQVALER